MYGICNIWSQIYRCTQDHNFIQNHSRKKNLLSTIPIYIYTKLYIDTNISSSTSTPKKTMYRFSRFPKTTFNLSGFTTRWISSRNSGGGALCHGLVLWSWAWNSSTSTAFLFGGDLMLGISLEPQGQPFVNKWMFGETTIFYIKIWNHPIETSIYKWLFGVLVLGIMFFGTRMNKTSCWVHLMKKLLVSWCW